MYVNHSLCSNLFGFIGGKSKENALSNFYFSLFEVFNKNLCMAGIFTDNTKPSTM